MPCAKALFLLVLFRFALLPAVSHGQYIGRATINARPQKLTLVDPTNGTRFTLDSSCITITVVSKNGKQLWKTDPWKAEKLEAYRVQRPVIVYFALGKSGLADSQSKFRVGQEVIHITYNNTMFGMLNKATGKFFYLGQD
jgi:hypothetical protein